ncbi:MAG: ribosome biogenesis GTPase Der [Epsilonproteobacteria bacterium]|nr:ribosome biogenesis GTPase Der [Campylobacterota bacterium]
MKIAILGKPNVGKSSLFNRLIKKREAIVSDVAGTTRDVKEKSATFGEKEAVIVDTGGLEERDDFFKKVKEKALESAKEADIILYVVDGKGKVEEEDLKTFRELQKLKKPIALVVNKIDNDKELENVWDFYRFGVEEIFPLSVVHNRNVKKLIEWIEAQLPKPLTLESDEELDLESFLETIEEEKKDKDKEINVAILGRVNVGKSSLLNALIKKERAIVSDRAGTTIDTVDESVIYKDKVITFVDTAGIRRRGRIEGIEKFALNRTQKMLERSDIALLVLDAKEGITEQDERIAGYIDKYKLATIIVINKWDIREKEYKEIVKEVRERFKFLSFAPIITLSAKTKKRVDRVFDLILKVYGNYTKRIPTSLLNKIISFAQQKHPIPSFRGKEVKIFYATQYDTKPPKISLVMNRPEALHFSYQRYLVNVLRENVDLEGTPVILTPKKRGEREEER